MTLEEELGLINGERSLFVSLLNRIHNVHDRVDEIVEFIASNDGIDSLRLNDAPTEENLGRRISQAFVSNPHINEVVLIPDVAVRDRNLLPWIAGRGTLEHMTSLERIHIAHFRGMSAQDWDMLFSLLLTSTSLQEYDVHFDMNWRDDAFVSACARYLRGSSLIHFGLYSFYHKLSEAAVLSLCDGVAGSSLRVMILYFHVASEANLKTVAERLVRAIAESSLEDVYVESELVSAISHTMPVRSLDFTLSQIGNALEGHLRINRKWRPLLANANVPLGLWPHILEKAHASRDVNYGSVGLLFLFLREKPDLMANNGFRVATGGSKKSAFGAVLKALEQARMVFRCAAFFHCKARSSQ